MNAASGTRFDLDAFRAALDAATPAGSDRYLIAFSGGMDSTVLLHACARLAAHAPDCNLRVVHVNHGLQQASGDWETACAQSARRVGLPFQSLRVAVDAPRGASPEAAARDARYTALADHLRSGECLMTAHHADDQLETVLLQLLRGAGPAGLAAMPARKRFGAGWHLRPLLGFRRAGIEDWARAQGIPWLEDPSNRDPAADRNYLRHIVLPGLVRRWPAAADSVSRSARLCAEAARHCRDLAHADLLAAGVERGPRAADLLALGPERARNALRHWIADRDLPLPSKVMLGQAERDVLAARPDASPLLRWRGAELRRFRGRLWLGPELPAPPAALRVAWAGDRPLNLGAGLGSLRFAPASGRGLRRVAFVAGHLEVGFRAGGETLRPVGSSRRRTLKNLFQEAGVLPWMRSRIPLIWLGGELAEVAGFWRARDLAARKDEAGLELYWDGHPRLR